MKKISSVKANVNIKTRILIFTGLLVLFLVLSPVAFAGRVGPALKLVEFAFPTRYNAVEQNITYFYMVTNSGDVSLTGDINITDNVTGTTTQSTDGLEVGSMLTGISIHTIIQADIDSGSVTNSAFATGSFNNQPVISPNTTATVIYEHPTNNPGPTNGGGLNNSSYGDAIVPVPKYDRPMYSIGPYWYGSEPSTTSVPNSNDSDHKAKVSSSKSSKAKLGGSKYKAYLKNHEQKNHTKKHRAEKNYHHNLDKK
jgi:hypothetical protein